MDLETPGGVPLEVILGIARDPVMMACIRVRDMRESLQFFIEKLGMTVLQFPLARTPGSQFEPDQPKGSTCIGYGDDSLKLLLIPSGPKDPPIQIGSMLQGITIVFDDSSDTLPAAAQGVSKQSPTTIYSPDGYPIILKPYTMFEKEATKEVPII